MICYGLGLFERSKIFDQPFTSLLLNGYHSKYCGDIIWQCMIGPLSIWSESSFVSGIAMCPLEMWQALGNFWPVFALTTGGQPTFLRKRARENEMKQLICCNGLLNFMLLFYLLFLAINRSDQFSCFYLWGLIVKTCFRSSPAGARHRCKEGWLRVKTEQLADRDDVIRRLHAHQTSNIENGVASKMCSCVLFPHLGQDDPLPLFLAVFIPTSTGTDGLDSFPESKTQPEKTHKKNVVHQSLDVQIDYFILSFGSALKSTSEAGLWDVSKTEEEFVRQVSDLANAAAAAEVGHALWQRACHACCSPQRQPLPSAEMRRLISHLQTEYFVPVIDLDPERLQPLLALPASWSQVVCVIPTCESNSLSLPLLHFLH